MDETYVPEGRIPTCLRDCRNCIHSWGENDGFEEQTCLIFNDDRAKKPTCAAVCDCFMNAFNDDFEDREGGSVTTDGEDAGLKEELNRYRELCREQSKSIRILESALDHMESAFDSMDNAFSSMEGVFDSMKEIICE